MAGGPHLHLATMFFLPLVLAGLPPLQQEYKISTEVRRVVLPVTVTDNKGVFVPGLGGGGFHGLRRRAAATDHDLLQPRHSCDGRDSGGQQRPRRNSTNLAALDFVRRRNPEDEVFVVNFNDRVSFGLPQSVPFAGDISQLQKALETIPGGKTSLDDAIAVALEHTERGTRDRKALIVISDGGDTASRRTFDDVLRMARASGTVIHSVATIAPTDYDSQRRPGLLRKLASAAGGGFFMPEKIGQVDAVCAQIAKELCSQYTVGYAPDTAGQKGEYHQVQVVVDAPARGKLAVRTPRGYLAPALRAATESKE